MDVITKIVEWFENTPEGKRQRAFQYNRETGEIEDVQNYEVTISRPVSVFAKKDIEKLRTHEARKVVTFAKEIANGNI